MSSARNAVESNMTLGYGSICALDVRWVPKTEFQVLLPFILMNMMQSVMDVEL